jgi:TolA-binding protein
MAFAVLSGCALWHNFSTYFNTVYLAESHVKAYEAEQRAIVPANPNGSIAVLNHRWLDEEYLMHQEGLRTGNLEPITPSFSQSLSATKEIKDVHLDSAIILGSKILADKKAGKYKEDALFIVGKAQFYKNDFIGAERKFHELLANYPDTKYGTQTRVFLARSMMLNHQVDTAARELQQEVATTADPAARSSLHRALAELIYAQVPDSLSGISNELHLAEEGLSGEDLPRLAYQEGAVYFIDGQWEPAERAFTLAINTSSDDWLIGESMIGAALAERELGNFEGARKQLQDVLEHIKYSPSQAAARYELAFTDELAAVAGDLHLPEFRQDDWPKLHAEYFALDTIYRNTSAQLISRAKFRQAEIYRGMGYYDSAAKMAAPLVGTKEFSSSAMNDYVTARASSLASYAEWRAELTHIDSLEATIQENERPHGNVGHLAPTNNEEAKIHLEALQEILGSRWNPATPVKLTKGDSTRLKETELRMRQKPRVVINDTARFLDSLKFRAATAHYQLGRAYETFGETTEARHEYETSNTMDVGPIDTGRTALRAQNLYAWLQLEHQAKNKPMQDSLLSELLAHFGETIYAQEARMLFGNADKNSPAELAYDAAYKTLRENGLDQAKPQFLTLVAKFPQEDAAPRSLYALGVSYEETPKYDSALAYYQRILKDYPYSRYALALRPRFAETAAVPSQHLPNTPRREENVPTSTVPGMIQQEPAQPPGMRQPPRRPGTQQPMPPALPIPPGSHFPVVAGQALPPPPPTPPPTPPEKPH